MTFVEANSGRSLEKFARFCPEFPAFISLD